MQRMNAHKVSTCHQIDGYLFCCKYGKAKLSGDNEYQFRPSRPELTLKDASLEI
jgi:hypothetical protein